MWKRRKMKQSQKENRIDLKKAVLRRQVYARFSTLNQMCKTTRWNNEKKEVIAYIRKNSKAILFDKKVPQRDRVAIILLLLGYPIYNVFWNIYCKNK